MDPLVNNQFFPHKPQVIIDLIQLHADAKSNPTIRFNADSVLAKGRKDEDAAECGGEGVTPGECEGVFDKRVNAV